MRIKRKRYNLFYLLVIFLLLLIFGCKTAGKNNIKNTKIPITIYKSAAIDIRSIDIEKIAVAPFTSKVSGESALGTKIADMLAKELSETMIYTVKGPDEVNSDLLINGLGIKPFMEKSELKKIGEALNVDAFFLGEVKKSEIVNKTFSKVMTEKEPTGEGEYVTNDEGKLEYKEKTIDVDVDMECRSGTGIVTVRFILYNARTGNLIFDRVESLSEEVDAFCFRANLNPDKMSRDEVNELLTEIAQELTTGFVTLLTPPANTELVIFESLLDADQFSKNLLDIGIDYAKMGDWPKAIDHLKQCKDRNRESPEAHYNLGVAYQGYGWLEKALIEVKDAQKRKSKKLYNDTIIKLKKAIKESRKKES